MNQLAFEQVLNAIGGWSSIFWLVAGIIGVWWARSSIIADKIDSPEGSSKGLPLIPLTVYTAAVIALTLSPIRGLVQMGSLAALNASGVRFEWQTDEIDQVLEAAQEPDTKPFGHFIVTKIGDVSFKAKPLKADAKLFWKTGDDEEGLEILASDEIPIPDETVVIWAKYPDGSRLGKTEVDFTKW